MREDNSSAKVSSGMIQLLKQVNLSTRSMNWPLIDKVSVPPTHLVAPCCKLEVQNALQTLKQAYNPYVNGDDEYVFPDSLVQRVRRHTNISPQSLIWRTNWQIKNFVQ